MSSKGRDLGQLDSTTRIAPDEIVVECTEDQADAAAAWLKQAMVDALAPLIDPVPVEVEVKVGRTWGGDFPAAHQGSAK